MTSTEWRQKPHLIDAAATALNTEPLRSMLEIVRNEHPGIFPLSKLGTSPDDKIMELGRFYGYQGCIDSLILLAQPAQTQTTLTPTFEDPAAQ